jgi:Phage Terminase
VTYAGYEGESTLLEELFNRGKQQPLVGDELYAGDGLVMAWHTKPIAPWQDEDWAKSMRRERPSAYQRQFLNEFASSSSQFIDLSKWDRCIDHTIGHMLNNPTLPVWVGVDASYKHDQTAICVVTFDKSCQQARLVTHRVFQPTPDQPLDFELTIEVYLLDLMRRFRVRSIFYDPWQMQATAQRLIKAGLPLEEFPQSSPNLTAASQNLFDLIESQSIVLYPDQHMRLAVSRCVAIEGPRGWRIGKDKSAFKIDVIVALAMATYAATQGAGKSTYHWEIWDEGFVDYDRRVAPPASQAEASPPLRSDNSNWHEWREAQIKKDRQLRQMQRQAQQQQPPQPPPQPQQRSSADQRLMDLYSSVNTAIQWGKIR